MRLLFGEIKQQGYTGSYSHLARFIAPWKDAGRPLDFIVEAPLVSLRRQHRRRRQPAVFVFLRQDRSNDRSSHLAAHRSGALRQAKGDK